VYSTKLGGLGKWDGVDNMVRHYMVSSYLLKHSRPLIYLQNTWLLWRGDLKKAKTKISSLKFHKVNWNAEFYSSAPACFWGYVPYYMRPDPSETKINSPGIRSLPFSTKRHYGGYLTRISIPKQSRLYARSTAQSTAQFMPQFLEVELNPSTFNSFSLTDAPVPLVGLGNNRIIFYSPQHKNIRYRISVGSCPQWYGFKGNYLYLLHENPEEMRSVSLQ
jgi:hypothetical protein